MEFGPIGAVIYFGTFVMGLLLANWIITTAFSLSVELLAIIWPFCLPRAAPLWAPSLHCISLENSCMDW